MLWSIRDTIINTVVNKNFIIHVKQLLCMLATVLGKLFYTMHLLFNINIIDIYNNPFKLSNDITLCK
jgi:hypothetical protein